MIRLTLCILSTLMAGVSGSVWAADLPSQANDRAREAQLIKEARAQLREEKRKKFEAITPEGEATISAAVLQECVEMWEQRLPYGYETLGYTYRLRLEPGTSGVYINGAAKGLSGAETQYQYVCALTDAMSVDRPRTYFSIRMDEQIRSKKPEGVFGNPQLKPHTQEEIDQYEG